MQHVGHSAAGHLEERQQRADVGVDVQLPDGHVAHGVRALPLAAPLRHRQVRVQVKAAEARHPDEPADEAARQCLEPPEHYGHLTCGLSSHSSLVHTSASKHGALEPVPRRRDDAGAGQRAAQRNDHGRRHEVVAVAAILPIPCVFACCDRPSSE